jgi:hypothetical protein
MRRDNFTARFVLALAEDGEREGEEDDQQQDQDPERQTLPHPISSLEYESEGILTQSAWSVLRDEFAPAVA